MQLQRARQEIARESRNKRSGLTNTDVDALLVAGSTNAADADDERRFGAFQGILVGAGAGSLIWVLAIWALLRYLL